MNNLFVKKVCCLSSAFCRVSFRVFRKVYSFLAEDFQTWTFGSFVSRQKNVKSEKRSLFVDAVASTSSATKSFITRRLSLPKEHYFYCIKIRVLSRTSLMLLWKLKNAIISTTLREPCDIKTIRKIPHTVASTSSATKSSITRCLSLSKAHSHSCSLWFRLRSITGIMFQPSVTEPMAWCLSLPMTTRS